MTEWRDEDCLIVWCIQLMDQNSILLSKKNYIAYVEGEKRSQK